VAHLKETAQMLNKGKTDTKHVPIRSWTWGLEKKNKIKAGGPPSCVRPKKGLWVIVLHAASSNRGDRGRTVRDRPSAFAVIAQKSLARPGPKRQRRLRGRGQRGKRNRGEKKAKAWSLNPGRLFKGQDVLAVSRWLRNRKLRGGDTTVPCYV